MAVKRNPIFKQAEDILDGLEWACAAELKHAKRVNERLCDWRNREECEGLRARMKARTKELFWKFVLPCPVCMRFVDVRRTKTFLRMDLGKCKDPGVVRVLQAASNQSMEEVHKYIRDLRMEERRIDVERGQGEGIRMIKEELAAARGVRAVLGKRICTCCRECYQRYFGAELCDRMFRIKGDQFREALRSTGKSRRALSREMSIDHNQLRRWEGYEDFQVSEGTLNVIISVLAKYGARRIEPMK